MNDPLVNQTLVRPGARIGHTVIVKQETGSTNDDARELAESGADHGVVVIAERQKRGRGRKGRTWHSPPGRNLAFSVVLRLGLPAGDTGLVTIGAGVAVASALAELCNIPARIKWPNDVRVKGKKLAGILAEADGQNTIDYVVLGVGVNVNIEADEMPDDIREIATSLLIETKNQWPRVLVFKRIMEGLESIFGELESGNYKKVLEGWQGLAEAMGRRVRVETPGPVVTGTVMGIRDDGALRIKNDGGDEEIILAGDVIII